jgi:hypothetical protein
MSPDHADAAAAGAVRVCYSEVVTEVLYKDLVAVRVALR